MTLADAKKITRGHTSHPVLAEAVRRHADRTRRAAVEAHRDQIQQAFRAQRAALLPYLSRILDLRRFPNPDARAAAIRALFDPLPIARAVTALHADVAPISAAYARSLLPASSKHHVHWADAFTWQRKAPVTMEYGATLPPDVAAQFPRLGERISRQWQMINDTTVNAIIGQVEEGLRRGYTPLQIANGFEREDYGGIASEFDRAIGYRTEMIARTEAMNAYNWGAWQSYGDAGVGQIEAVDGTDFDRDCRERNGQRYEMDPLSGDPIDNGYGTTDHPLGSLCWFPLVGTIDRSFAAPAPGETGVM